VFVLIREEPVYLNSELGLLLKQEMGLSVKPKLCLFSFENPVPTRKAPQVLQYGCPGAWGHPKGAACSHSRAAPVTKTRTGPFSEARNGPFSEKTPEMGLSVKKRLPVSAVKQALFAAQGFLGIKKTRRP